VSLRVQKLLLTGASQSINPVYFVFHVLLLVTLALLLCQIHDLMQTIPTPAPDVQRKLFLGNYTTVRQKELAIARVSDHFLINARTSLELARINILYFGVDRARIRWTLPQFAGEKTQPMHGR
jgi:hypothetical protein